MEPTLQKIYSYKDLIVWQKAMDLVEIIYTISNQFPDGEKFGLTSQMRRAAVSIPSNIAEGRARGSRKDFTQFLHVALGSGMELHTQLSIAQRLSYINTVDYNQSVSLLDEVLKMLRKSIGTLKAKS